MLIAKYIEEMTAPKSTGFFGKIDSMFSGVKAKISQGAKELDEKYDIKGKGEKALIYGRSVGDKIAVFLY